MLSKVEALQPLYGRWPDITAIFVHGDVVLQVAESDEFDIEEIEADARRLLRAAGYPFLDLDIVIVPDPDDYSDFECSCPVCEGVIPETGI